MEQAEIPSMDTNHLNIGFSQLPLLFSSLLESTGMRNASNNSLPGYGWLGCSHKDGWAPLSPYYSDISPCFLQGIIFGISSILMIGAGTYQIGILRNVKVNVGNRVSWSFYAKIILVALQFVFQIGLFITYHNKDIIALSLALNGAAIIVSFGLHYIEQFKATIPNGVLLFYWLFQIVLNLGKIVNLNLRNSINSHFAIITIVSCVNAGFILFLEIYFPVQPRIPFKTAVKTSPYDSANVV